MKMISEGKSQRKVAEFFKCSQCAISKMVKKCNTGGSLEDMPRSGRKSRLLSCDLLKIKRISNNNPFLNAREILHECGLSDSFSHSSMRRVLRSIGLYGRIARKNNLLSKINRKKRLRFCKNMSKWNKTKWNNVVFSDEKTIQLSPRIRLMVRRPIQSKNNLRYTFKFKYSEKRSVMFWGYIKYNGERGLYEPITPINSSSYCAMLKDNFTPLSRPFIFQQDNAPPHRAKNTQMFFRKVNLLKDWLPLSPDLNIIENIWSTLKDKVSKRFPSNKLELINIAHEEFDKINSSLIQKLYDSIPRRVMQVIKRKGGQCDY